MASKLVITSSPVAGVASGTPTLGPITIQRQDTFGNPVTAGSSVTVTLTSSATAKFATTSGGSPIASAIIPAGASSVDVYFGDTVIGSPTITASLSGLTAATQIEKIGKLCFVSTIGTACLIGTQTVGNNGTFSGRVELVDSANNPITATSAISVTLTPSGDLATPSPSGVTIAAQQSVSGILNDQLSQNGNQRQGVLTAHAGTGTAGDAIITIHA
jgi:hypothetical protein